MIPEICPTCMQEVAPIKHLIRGGANDVLTEIDRFDFSTVDPSNEALPLMSKAVNLMYKAADEIKRLREEAVKRGISDAGNLGIVDIIARLESCNCQKPEEAMSLMREAAIWLRSMRKFVEMDGGRK